VSDSEPVKTPEFSVPLTKEDLAQLGQFNAIGRRSTSSSLY
jgi:hypothetical protein